LGAPFAAIFSPFNLKKGDVVGLLCNLQILLRIWRRRRCRDKALLYGVFRRQTPMAVGGHPREMKWVATWRLFDHSARSGLNYSIFRDL